MHREVDVRVRVKRVRKARSYEPKAVGSTIPEMIEILTKYGRWGHGRHRTRTYDGGISNDLTPRLRPRG